MTIKKHSADPLSILIILMGSLGDVARGLCLVSHIKQYQPNGRVTWLIEPKWVELVKAHREIDEIIVFERSWHLSPVRKLKKDLAARHFDITLDLQRHFKSGFFSYISGAKRRIGFHRHNAKEFNWIFNNERIGFFSDDLPKLHHYLKFTEYLGLPTPTSLDFGLSEIALKNIAPGLHEKINEKPGISVVLGSSWESKDWFPDQYFRLIQNLLSLGRKKVILLGDRSNVPIAASLTAGIGSSGIINTVGKTSLIELIGILKSSAAAVGPDSGPGHVAAAVGTPYVTLFGPTSPRRFSDVFNTAGTPRSSSSFSIRAK